MHIQPGGVRHNDVHPVHLQGNGFGAVPGAGPTQESETRARGNNRGSLAGSRLKLKRRLTALRRCEVWDGTRILIPRAPAPAGHPARRAHGRRGQLRLGVTGSASYGVLPRLVGVLSAKLPDLQLEIRTEMLTPQQEVALLNGQLDLGILRRR